MKYPHTPTIEDERFLKRFRAEMRFTQAPSLSKAMKLALPKLGRDFSGRTRDVIENEDGSTRLGPEYVPDPHRPPTSDFLLKDTIAGNPSAAAALLAAKSLMKPKRRRRRRRPKAVTA